MHSSNKQIPNRIEVDTSGSRIEVTRYQHGQEQPLLNFESIALDDRVFFEGNGFSRQFDFQSSNASARRNSKGD